MASAPALQWVRMLTGSPGFLRAVVAARGDDARGAVGLGDRRELAVERILPLHGRMVPVAELYTTAGRKP